MFENTSEKTSSRMSRVRKKDTSAEMCIRSYLHKIGLRYRANLKIFHDVNITPDIVFTKLRLAIFVDGCFWHGCPLHATWPKTNSAWWHSKILKNVERDRKTDIILASKGWKVIRIWEHEDPVQAVGLLVNM